MASVRTGHVFDEVTGAEAAIGAARPRHVPRGRQSTRTPAD